MDLGVAVPGDALLGCDVSPRGRRGGQGRPAVTP
jgi:hypothetical protein